MSGVAKKEDFIIADFLSYGKDNAIHQRELVEITCMKPTELKIQIQKERDAGAFICGDNDGYYLAADHLEEITFIRTLEKSARRMSKTARALKKAQKYGEV